jgi:hypothetical protein
MPQTGERGESSAVESQGDPRLKKASLNRAVAAQYWNEKDKTLRNK